MEKINVTHSLMASVELTRAALVELKAPITFTRMDIISARYNDGDTNRSVSLCIHLASGKKVRAHCIVNDNDQRWDNGTCELTISNGGSHTPTARFSGRIFHNVWVVVAQ